jgi:uncharacterized protein YegL
LCFVIQQYGQVIITEPKRCKGMLSDLAPHHRLEINLLIAALEQKVAQELLKPTALIPVAMQLDRLAQRLHDTVGIKEDFAYWAVESWALALNVIQQPMPKQTAQSISNISPLHFIWIVDCSNSMEGSKIESLNHAIKEFIPTMRQVAADNANAEVLIRVVKFSNSAQWHVAQPTKIDEFNWQDLKVDGGLRAMGAALHLVAEQLKMLPKEERGLPPVLVLISDGQPSDDFASGLNALMKLPWGKKAVRIAITIGDDADLEVMEQFIGNPELPPLQAQNAEQLINYIRWVF